MHITSIEAHLYSNTLSKFGVSKCECQASHLVPYKLCVSNLKNEFGVLEHYILVET